MFVFQWRASMHYIIWQLIQNERQGLILSQNSVGSPWVIQQGIFLYFFHKFEKCDMEINVILNLLCQI